MLKTEIAYFGYSNHFVYFSPPNFASKLGEACRLFFFPSVCLDSWYEIDSWSLRKHKRHNGNVRMLHHVFSWRRGRRKDDTKTIVLTGK